MTLTESARQTLTDPLTYAPLAMGAATGAFDDPYEYEEPPPRPPADTGYGDYTLAGGTPRKSKTQEELLAMALGGEEKKCLKIVIMSVMQPPMKHHLLKEMFWIHISLKM
jgi:hypothetical protein